MAFVNLLLVYREVPDAHIFVESVNEHTCAVLYSSETTQEELMRLIREKTLSAERIGFVSRKNDLFVEGRSFLESKEVLVSLIRDLGTTHMDFLACDTLNDPLWKGFYDSLEGIVVVGASADRTGNLKYGGNWLMESTLEDVETVYFTSSIEYYKYLLDLGTHGFYVKSDGLYAYGQNTYGQCGLTGTQNRTIPERVFNFTRYSEIKNISTGRYHTMILLNTGELFATGLNDEGQLSDGTNNNRDFFKKVDEITDVIQVACGAYHTMIIKGTRTDGILSSSGILLGVGWNYSGQLGNGTKTNVLQFGSTPIQSNVIKVSCGSEHTMIIREDGPSVRKLLGAGLNTHARLGTNNITDSSVFVPSKYDAATEINNALYVACGDSHTMMIGGTLTGGIWSSSGTVFGAGDNGLGQLGKGYFVTNSNFNDRVFRSNSTTPVNNAVKLVCGLTHTLVLKNNGTLYGTGDNSFKQLGTISTTAVFTQISVSGISTIYDMDCTDYNSRVLIINPQSGTYDLYVTGSGSASGTGLTSGTTSFMKVADGVLVNSLTCYRTGTKILTEHGYVAVEDLCIGDLLETPTGKRPIQLIGSRDIVNVHTVDRFANKLYVLSPVDYPDLTEELIVTGAHSILVDALTEEQQAKIPYTIEAPFKIGDKFRLPVCLDERAQPYEKEIHTTVYHFSLECEDESQNHAVYANGLLSETCCLKHMRERSCMKHP